MGDERGYAGRFCPDCKDPIALDARQCACGWGAPKRKQGDVPKTNPRCTWQSGLLGCRYPVARFDLGARSGFCIFHRATPSGFEAAAIARASEDHTPEQYLERAKAHMYGDGSDNHSVALLRAQLRKVDNGARVSLFARALPAREPGADEDEADAHVARADAAQFDALNEALAHAGQEAAE